MNKGFLFLLLFLIVFFGSCKIKKEATLAHALPVKSLKELIEEVNNKNSNQPKWAFLKGTIKVEKEEGSVSLNLAIKNSKDSLIWASVSGPFGIEIFRMQITKDSIYFINKSSKEFSVKPIHELREYLGKEISFSEINNILMGAPTLTNNKKTLEKDSVNYILKLINAEYLIDMETYRIKEFKIIEEDGLSVFSFSKFKDIEGFLFPLKWTLTSNIQEQFSLMIDYSKIIFNEPQNISFKIPKQYVEIK